MTAPPTLICETNQYADLPATRTATPGHTWGIELPGTRTGARRQLVRSSSRIRPDDVITATWEITDMTEKRTGRAPRC